MMVALSDDKITGWATSVGIERDATAHETYGMHLLWRYLNESPVMRGIFQVPAGRDLGLPYLDVYDEQDDGRRALVRVVDVDTFDLHSNDPRVAAIVRTMIESRRLFIAALPLRPSTTSFLTTW